MKRINQVKIYKGEKYYVAECLDLPVVTQGKTLDEAVENIRKQLTFILSIWLRYCFPERKPCEAEKGFIRRNKTKPHHPSA